MQGEETRQQMNAELYLECSAKYQENVEDIFREATKRTLAFNRKHRNYKRQKKCVVLWGQKHRKRREDFTLQWSLQFFLFFCKRTTLSHWEWLDVQRPKMLAVRADAGAAWFGDAGRGDAVPKSLHPIESSSKVTRANDITGKTILQAAAVQLEIPSVNIYFIHIWEMLPLVFLYI